MAQHQHQHQQQNLHLQQDFMFNSQNMALNMPLPAVQPTPPQRQPKQKPPSSAGKQNQKPPSGILNPLYAKADFNLPQHPYQDVYVAPSSGHGHPQGGYWWSS